MGVDLNPRVVKMLLSTGGGRWYVSVGGRMLGLLRPAVTWYPPPA